MLLKIIEINNKNEFFSCLCVILFFLCSCNRNESAIDIITKTINTIDTIETIYYKQDMTRTNPQNTNCQVSQGC